MPSLPRSLRAPRPRSRRALRPHLETVEVRITPALTASMAAVVMQPVLQDESASIGGLIQTAQGWSEATPWGMSPQQIRAAYGLDDIAFGAIQGDGTGQTITIVDAYDDPSLVDSTAPGFSSSDLARFDQQYGLPDPPSFVKLNQEGSTTQLPGTDPSGAGNSSSWEQEEALDVEWAHALAPGASLILVEANSSSNADLCQSVTMAAALPGVSVVSMSWGCAEYSGENTFDGDFTTPGGHQGVTFVAAVGDMGSPGLYPAYSPNVVAVGGTSLTILGNKAYGSETAWSDSGGGTSTTEFEPAYQDGVQGTGMRTIPDVAFDADPNTGVSVYDSYDDTTGDGPWKEIGGTSLGAPCWAALIAIADQGRVAEGGATLDGPSQTLPALYSLSAGEFHDITTGSNGGFNAGPGYDEVTGLGSPVADVLVPDLASYDIGPALAVTAGPPADVTAGDPFGLTIAVQNPDGSVDASYLGTVTIALASNPGGDTLGGTLTATAHDGLAVFSGLTLTRADDGYTLQATTNGPAATATVPFDVMPATPAQLVIAPSPTSGALVGLTISVRDSFGNLETTYGGSVTIVWGAHAGHGRAARPKTLSATAGAGQATFARVKLGAKGRGYALQAAADGLTTAAVLTLEATPVRVKPLRGQARIVLVPPKPAGHHIHHTADRTISRT
jgi:hypothetical protein